MTFIWAYAICTTLLSFLLAARLFRDLKEPPTAVMRVAGQSLFFLALVGMCALAARGLIEIVEAVK